MRPDAPFFPVHLYLILLLLLSCVIALSGQEGADSFKENQARNAIGIYWGFHSNWSQDLVFSPMIYKGNSFTNLQLQYQRNTAKGLHRIGLAFDKMEASSTNLIQFTSFNETISRIPSEILQVNINYGYAREITTGKKLNIHLGALLETKLHLTKYNFGVSDDEGYILMNSLKPWLMAAYDLDVKNGIQVELLFPILSFVSRPEYAIVDNNEIQNEGSDLAFLYQKGELASFGALLAKRIALSYTRTLSPRTQFSFGYTLDYLKYKKPEAIRVLKNNFDAGLTFSF